MGAASEKPALVQKLAYQGMTVKEIAAKTGLSEKTVYNYASGLLRGKGESKSVMRPGFGEEWLEAVNRIRKYCGIRPLKSGDLHV